MRAEELKARLERVRQLREDKGVGFKDLITVLGKGAHTARGTTTTTTPVAGGFAEIQDGAAAARTFCSVPRGERHGEVFERVVMNEAADEMGAHMTMFYPRQHAGYYGMSGRAAELVVSWVEEAWCGGGEVEVGVEVDGGGEGGIGLGVGVGGEGFEEGDVWGGEGEGEGEEGVLC